MASDIDKHALTSAIADSISTVAAAIGFTGGFTYVAGYLAVSFYLSQYGVSTLSLVQSRYFAAGGLYLIVSLLISSAPVLSLGMIDRAVRENSSWVAHRRGLLLLLASSLLLSVVVIWLVRHVLTTIDDHMVAMPLSGRRAVLSLSLPASQVALLFPVAVYYLARWYSLGRWRVGEPVHTLWIPAIFASTFVVSILISIFVFARFVYPYSTASLGGGALSQVQLVLSEELTGREAFPLGVSGGVTEPVLLLDQSANAYLLLDAETGRVLEIADEQVLAVLRK